MGIGMGLGPPGGQILGVLWVWSCWRYLLFLLAFITIAGSGILSHRPGQDGQRRKGRAELSWPRSVCTSQCLEEALGGGDTDTGVFRGGGGETPKDALLNPCLE